MSRERVTVVVSQAQGKHPAKRALEESLTAALLVEPGVEVAVVPHLYDLGPDHTGLLFLNSVRGDLIVLSWLYPRAAFWLLDRDGIKGHFGESQLQSASDDEEEEESGEQEPPRGIGAVDVPQRWIYCLDLREFNSHQPYLDEVRRIVAECRQRRDQTKPNGQPTLVQLGVNLPTFSPEQLLAPANRRWYPVIDYSRCTNCMECLDFCLFGVYGVDSLGRINVETQDACKKGCPACSRVCPEQAIMFPDYKSPAIAGAPVGGTSGLKIDLTRLFGGDDAIKIAASERDRELVAAGREAVGLTVGIPKRQANRAEQPRDELDHLTDALDALDL
jgi:Pyruvate/2-oxoacid:ferredoxin oxidoreductase delta subunit